MRPLRVLELYPFGRGLGQAFRARGHLVFTLDFKLQRKEYTADGEVSVEALMHGEPTPPPGPWDLVLARPFCPTYSPAARFMHYRDTKTGAPLAQKARDADDLVRGQLRFIRFAAPRLGWALENPHGELRKCDFMQGIPVVTVTLCQYGDRFRKATDLFGPLPPAFAPRACAPGAPCHTGSRWVNKKGEKWGAYANNGAAAREFDRRTAWQRAYLPFALSEALAVAAESSLKE